MEQTQPPQAQQTPPPNQPPQKQGMGTGGKVAIGCGVALLACVLVCAGGAWWLYSNARQLASEAMAAPLRQVINQSNIPSDQKRRLVERVDDLKGRFAAGEITANELGRVVEQLAQSPILPMGAVMLVEQQYVAPSSLSDEEKQDARLTLDRFARGLYEKKIDTDRIEHVITPISTQDAQGDRQLKQNPTADELREFLARAQASADNADVSDEPFEVDLAAAFDRAVADALDESPQRGDTSDSP